MASAEPDQMIPRDHDQQRPGDEPLRSAWEINARWRAVWMRAIARSWRSEAIAEQAKQSGRASARQEELSDLETERRAEEAAAKADDFKKKLLDPRTTLAALEEVGMPLPDFFRDLLQIEVLEHSGGDRYHHDADGNGWRHFGEGLQAKLTLTLPPAPRDPQDFAVALADYESGGRIYPFTIC